MPPSVLPAPDTSPEFYENVVIKRAIAWCIDLGVALAVALVILPFTFFIALFFFLPLLVFASFLYRWICFAKYGATLGMWLMSLNLRTKGNRIPDQTTALLYALGTTVALSVPPLHLISIAMIIISDTRQGLMDQVLHTTILNRAARA